MKLVLYKTSIYSALKITSVVVLVIYSVVLTYLVFKLDPKPLVIGIDSFGTRIVSSESDSLLKQEKIKMLKTFITSLYGYDESNFDDRISQVGDMMSDELWNEKKEELLRISNRLKTEPLTEKVLVSDLREIDETHFEADLDLKIENRLRKSESKIRIAIEIKKAPRTLSKPYPWEVIRYDEQAM